MRCKADAAAPYPWSEDVQTDDEQALMDAVSKQPVSVAIEEGTDPKGASVLPRLQRYTIEN